MISNQAMISGTNFGLILSDDPTTPAPDDPTVITMRERFGTTEFFSTDATGTIDPMSTEVIEIVVAGADPYLWDVNLQTFIPNIEAPGFVDITLISPGGIVVTIVSTAGSPLPITAGLTGIFDGTIWDDDAGDILAPGPITDFTFVPGETAATAVPEEALGALIGIDPNGTWMVRIANNSTTFAASIGIMELELTTLPSAPTTAISLINVFTVIAIPDNTTIQDTIVFAGLSNVICKVRVRTDITHTWSADLDIFLISPSGTEVTLTTDNGGGNDNVFNGTVWQDDAGATNPPGPVTDTTFVDMVTENPIVPEEAMSAFNGEDPNGIWTLRITDDTALDVGTLNRWALVITTCDPGGEPEAYGNKFPIQFVNDVAPLGQVNLGDTIRYAVQIRNIGRGTAETITFSDPLSSQFALVEGSVTTSQGVVTQGNDPGDTDIQVNVGDVAAGCTFATINFDVLLVGPAEIYDFGSTEPMLLPGVSNQGTIVGSNFPATVTDDDADPDDGLEPSRLLITASGPDVSASKVDTLQVDVGMDGLFNEGDTVRYTVTVTNDGDTNVGGATYMSALDPNSTLLTGSVTTTQGTILTGNTAGDTSIGIDLGSLVGFGGAVTITYDVTINGSLPVEVMGLSCQGEIDGNNIDTVRTDDPAWPGPADPTITPIGSEDLASTVRIIQFLLGQLNDPRGLDVNGDGAIDAADVIFSKTQLEPVAASNPMPANGATGVPVDMTFSWTDPDMRSVTFQFALSFTGGGALVEELPGLTSPQATLSANLAFSTTYDWVVISINSAGAATGSTWTFTTEAAPLPLPGAPSSPSPVDGNMSVGVGAFLIWTAGADATSYDLFLWPSAEAQPGTPTGADIMDTSFNPDLVAGTPYSWQVISKNATGQTPGPIWTFTTSP